MPFVQTLPRPRSLPVGPMSPEDVYDAICDKARWCLSDRELTEYGSAYASTSEVSAALLFVAGSWTHWYAPPVTVA